MVELSGIEPLTSCVQGRRSPSWAIAPIVLGVLGSGFIFQTSHTKSFFIRWFFKAVKCASHMSQLKKTRSGKMVGLGGFEPPTSPLSGVRSNQLSYRPRYLSSNTKQSMWILTKNLLTPIKGGDPAPGSPRATLLRLHPSHESQSGNRPPEG